MIGNFCHNYSERKKCICAITNRGLAKQYRREVAFKVSMSDALPGVTFQHSITILYTKNIFMSGSLRDQSFLVYNDQRIWFSEQSSEQSSGYREKR